MPMPNQLQSQVKVSVARRALAEAKTLKDVLRIRDQAQAAKVLMELAGASLAAIHGPTQPRRAATTPTR